MKSFLSVAIGRASLLSARMRGTLENRSPDQLGSVLPHRRGHDGCRAIEMGQRSVGHRRPLGRQCETMVLQGEEEWLMEQGFPC